MEKEASLNQISEASSGKIEAIDKTISNSISMLDRADATVVKIQEANKRAEELVLKQEAIASRIALSGRADAGFIEKKEEISDRELARKVMKGEINPYTL